MILLICTLCWCLFLGSLSLNTPKMRRVVHPALPTERPSGRLRLMQATGAVTTLAAGWAAGPQLAPFVWCGTFSLAALMVCAAWTVLGRL